MISRSLILAGSLLISASWSLGGEAPEEVKTAGYHLKNRSSFSAPVDARAPFWPIGWTPTSTKALELTTAAPVIDVVIKPEQFNVTSILLGSQSLAVINGRTYAEGEFIRMPRAPRTAEAKAAAPTAKIRVTRIADGLVTLQAGGQAVEVPLKRQQLSAPKGNNDDLLDVGEG